jgi:dolichol-phosphate mannosyltransferase
MNKVLIGIPCYRCSVQIKRVISSFEELKLPDNFIFLFVDNNSPDSTVSSILESLDTRLKAILIKNFENYGLGGTQKIIFQYAIDNLFDSVIVFHGDDQADPNDVLALTSKFENQRAHYLGSRFSFQSKRIGYQTTRVIGNMGLNAIFSLFTRKLITDLGSGINLFHVKDLKNIPYQYFSNDFNFNVDLLLSLITNRQGFFYVPITWRESDQVSNARNFKVAFSMLKSLLAWLLNKKVSYPFKFNYHVLKSLE